MGRPTGLKRWTLILVAPQEAWNVGGAARVLRNFGGVRLRVVAPRCEVNGSDARRFSSGAADILRAAEHFDSLEAALHDVELSIALTGVPGRHHRIDCGGLVPSALVEGREEMQHGALVFGREERGLLGEELELCDFLWSLPTNPDFPSLNLVQAIGIALAGLAEAERALPQGSLAPSAKALNPLAGSPAPEDAPATNGELIHLGRSLLGLMTRTGWDEGRRTANTLAKLRNLFVRGRITRREVNLLHGLCKHTVYTLDNPEKAQKRAAKKEQP